MGKRCARCRKKEVFPYVCKACEKGFCVACIQRETHACPVLADVAAAERARLAATLESARSVKPRP